MIVVPCVALIGYYGWLRPNAEPVTLEEYAAVICNLDSSPADLTWGEVRGSLRDRLGVYKRLEPPPEIMPFHEGRVVALGGVSKAMRGKDGNAPMNELELAFDPDIRAAMQADKKGVRSLPPADRRVLYKHGCRF